MTTAMRRVALLTAVLGLAAAGLATGAWHLLRSQARVARAGREAVQGRTWDALVDRLVDEHYLPLVGLPAATRQPRAA